MFSQYSFKRICLLTVTAIALNSGLWMLPIAPAQAGGWWSRFFTSRPPDDPEPRGGRGEAFCAIAPAETQSESTTISVVSSDRPSLVWRGNIQTVELWSSNGTEALQRIEITPDATDSLRLVQLDAERRINQLTLDLELQPGQHYEWRMYRPFVSAPVVVRFAVLPADQQAQVQQRLPVTEETGEAAATQRADYFAGQQLWSEFWQELLAIESPSDELRQIMSNSSAYFCPRLDEEGNLVSSGVRSQSGQSYRDFPLTGSAGQAVDIFLTSDDFEPSLVLLNSAGEVLTEVVAEGRQVRLATVLPEEGTYTIRVTSMNAQAQPGEYRLRVIALP